MNYNHVERNHLLNLSDYWPQKSYSHSRFLLYHTHEIQSSLVHCKHAIKPAPRLFLMLSLFTTVQKIEKEIKRSLRYMKYFCPKYDNNLTQ